jgi:hypothetical protein
MIDRYLERGDLFVLEDNGIKAVGVVTKEGPDYQSFSKFFLI